MRKELRKTDTHPGTNRYQRMLGRKHYELTNHLGNVLSTVTDRKLAIQGTGGLVEHWMPETVSFTDYYPFGMQMDGRTGFKEGYRWGFQGQEKDDEVKGEGNSINYRYRMHDPRIGRFFAVDPLAAEYPWNSPYAFSENRTTNSIELEGLEAVDLPSFDPNLKDATKQEIDNHRKITGKAGLVALMALGLPVTFKLASAFLIPIAVSFATNPSAQLASGELASFVANLFYEGPDDILPTMGPGGELGKSLRGTSKIFKNNLTKILSKSFDNKIGKKIISKVPGSADDAFKKFKSLIGDSKVVVSTNGTGKVVHVAKFKDGTKVTFRNFSSTEEAANAVIDINNSGAKSAKKGKGLEIKFFDESKE